MEYNNNCILTFLQYICYKKWLLETTVSNSHFSYKRYNLFLLILLSIKIFVDFFIGVILSYNSFLNKK